MIEEEIGLRQVQFWQTKKVNFLYVALTQQIDCERSLGVLLSKSLHIIFPIQSVS